MCELEINTENSQERTYIRTNSSESEIRRIHYKILSSLGIKHCERYNTLPRIYGISKMHKMPIKFRFITGAKCSLLKPLANILALILQHIKIHFKNYCNVIRESELNIIGL